MDPEKEPFKYLLQHLFFGVVAAITFGVLVLATDLSHIRTMLMDASNPFQVLALMFFGLIVTFGSVAMGVGIMNLARDDDDRS
jgi:choline-glycine betaine transporter